MKSVIFFSLFSLMAVLISGCKNVSDEEAWESCLNNHDDVKGAISAAKRIIASGADVNTTRTIGGIAPLHVAVAADDIEFAQLLISKGADIDIKDDSGFTPLSYSNYGGRNSTNDSIKMIELLLKHGANPNSNSELLSTLMSACQNSNYEMVKYLVENGADVNLTNSGKSTALLYANDLRIINYLIGKGADVKAKDQNGETILMSIVRGSKNVAEKKEAILFLIEKGVEINAIERYGFFNDQTGTALDMAISSNQPEEIISLLKSKDAKTAAELKAEKPAPQPAPDEKVK